MPKRSSSGVAISVHNVTYPKVFGDPIHTLMVFHPVCVAIIDTPQFQRLRNIKQLGGGYFVYPGAAHNRFEHSLGVGHLAGLFARKLKEKMEQDEPLLKNLTEQEKNEIKITEEDILCVQIAGLCHDLGHGPFSHTFDKKFIPMCDEGSTWEHEEGSVDMFDHMIEENENVKARMKESNLTGLDIDFIKELISGKPKGTRGREKKKFLNEIVANKPSGVDVDKWDYLARDTYNLGIENNFDHKRLMELAKVVKYKDAYHIAYRDKQVEEVYQMFSARNILHRKACQHKTTVIAEYMLCEAFCKANEYLTFPVRDKSGKTLELLKLSDAMTDMRAYMQVDDSVYYRILHSEDKNLAESRDILKNLEERQLYVFVGQSTKDNLNEDETRKKLTEYMNGKFLEQDVIIQFCSYDYGKGSINPVLSVLFYDKQTGKPFKLEKNEVSKMTPQVFSEKYVNVYSRSREPKAVKRVKRHFEKFCSDNGYNKPKRGDPSTDPSKGEESD